MGQPLDVSLPLPSQQSTKSLRNLDAARFALNESRFEIRV
jgi:hypothetical protein